MNFFEDLVTDLQKENLLDNGVTTFSEFNESDFSPQKTTTKTTSKEFFTNQFYSPASKEHSSENILIEKTESPSEVKDPASEILDYNPVLLLHPVKPLNPLNKMQLKPKTRGRFCPTCLISVPYHRFTCKFCGERVTNSLIYYLFISFFILISVSIFFFIIANKTYK